MKSLLLILILHSLYAQTSIGSSGSVSLPTPKPAEPPKVEKLTELDILRFRNLALQQQSLINEKCANARIPLSRCRVDLERGLIVEGTTPTQPTK